VSSERPGKFGLNALEWAVLLVLVCYAGYELLR
jgi:hypothetical protein